MTRTGAVIVAAILAFVLTVATNQGKPPKDTSRAEAAYATGYVMACDSLAEAERVVELSQVVFIGSITEAIRVTNAEMGAGACAFSKLRYNTFAVVEQIPGKNGTSVFAVVKLGWVTSYQLSVENTKDDWIPVSRGPVDQYVVVLVPGRVI